jgi:hypothetical protein
MLIRVLPVGLLSGVVDWWARHFRKRSELQLSAMRCRH